MIETDIRLFGVNWATDTGGPSPDNNLRTELYFMGCEKAISGNPCKGCYNPDLWANRPGAIVRSPKNMVDHIVKHAPNKFITIVGGEPTDQLEGLVSLCKLLKTNGFHILLFTWKSLEHFISNFYINTNYIELLKNIDILIDGEYKETLRIYSENAGDGLFNTVGSGNQIIWDMKEWADTNYSGSINGIAANDLVGIYVLPNGDLRYIVKERFEQKKVIIVQKGAA